MKARSVRKFKETIEFRSLPINRIKGHKYFPITVVVAILLLVASVHVYQRVVVLGLVTDVSLLEKEHRGLIDGCEKVETDIAALSMSARIEQYAVDSLGMRRVTPDHLYTLVPETARESGGDDLSTMLSSIKRVARYLPVLTETQANANELQPIRLEADESGGDGQ